MLKETSLHWPQAEITSFLLSETRRIFVQVLNKTLYVHSNQTDYKLGVKSGKIHHRYFVRNQVTANPPTELNPLCNEDATVKGLMWEGDGAGMFAGWESSAEGLTQDKQLILHPQIEETQSSSKAQSGCPTLPPALAGYYVSGHKTTRRGDTGGVQDSSYAFPFSSNSCW